MKRGNEGSLGDAIHEFLQVYHLDDKLLEKKLILSWEKVMGKMVMNHTRNLSIKKKKLYVQLDSPALKNELSYSREKIRDALNNEVKGMVITEVIIC